MDPMTIGMVSSATGSLLGGAMQANSVEQTNARNARMTQEQMAFQERMSNTAHQRETADLRAAGLNPILSATGGSGASAPSGAMSTAQAPDRSFVGSAIKDSLNSGLTAANMRADLNSKNANVANTLADTANKLETAKVIGEDIQGKRTSNARSAATLQYDIEKSAQETGTARAEHVKRSHDAKRSGIETAAAEADLPRARAQSKADSEYIKYDNTIKRVQSGIDTATSALNVSKYLTRPQPPTPQQKRGSRHSWKDKMYK